MKQSILTNKLLFPVFWLLGLPLLVVAVALNLFCVIVVNLGALK